MSRSAGREYSPSFAFLAEIDPLLGRLPSRAEWYVHDDPETCLMVLRKFGEALARELLARAGMDEPPRTEQRTRLAVLEEAGEIDGKVSVAFKRLRISGNQATHSFQGSWIEARGCLEDAYFLGVWFFERYGGRSMKKRPYTFPKPPADRERQLRSQVASLQEQITSLKDTSSEATDAARRAVDDRDAALALAEEMEAQLLAEREHSASLERTRRLARQETADERRDRERRKKLAEQALPDLADYDRPSVWIEQQGHLQQFIGREGELASVRDRLDALKSGYVLLTGGPGLGKSALLAKLAEHAVRPHGSHQATRVREPVLLHMGKSGSAPRQILQFLLWQAGQHLERPFPAKVFLSGISDLRDQFLQALEGVVERYGSVLLVIDALDEIVRDIGEPARDLTFLPDHLPPGVRVVLSSRPLEPITTHLTRRLASLTVIEVPPLSTTDIDAILARRLDPQTLEWIRTQGLTEVILRRTSGIPLLLRHVIKQAPDARNITEKGSAVDSTDWIPTGLESVYADLYREACTPRVRRGARGTKLRQRIMSLLATTVEPLGATELQRALVALGSRVETQAVRSILAQLGGVLFELGDGNVRLYHEGLADYLLDEIGLDGQVMMHRALAGGPLKGAVQVEARFSPRVLHLMSWFQCAVMLDDHIECEQAATAFVHDMLRYPVVEAVLETGQMHELLDALNRVGPLFEEHLPDADRLVLHEWTSFLNRELGALVRRPYILHQQARFAPEEIVRSAVAAMHSPSRITLRQVWSSQSRDNRSLVRRTYPDSYGICSGARALQYSATADVFLVVRQSGVEVAIWSVPTGEKLWEHLQPNGLDEIALLQETGDRVALSTSAMEAPVKRPRSSSKGILPAGRTGVLMYDVRADRMEWEIEPRFEGNATALTFGPDGRRLYVATGSPAPIVRSGERTAVRIIDVSDGSILARSSDDATLAPVSVMAFTADSGCLVTGGGWYYPDTCEIVLWDPERLGAVRRISMPDVGPVVALVPSGPRGMLAVCGDGTIVSGITEGAQLSVQRTPLNRVRVVRVLPSEDDLLIGMGTDDYKSMSMKVVQWRLSEGRIVRELPVAGLSLMNFALTSRANEWLVASKAEVSLRELPEIEEPVCAIDDSRRSGFRYLSPDVRLACVEAEPGHLGLADVSTGVMRSGARVPVCAPICGDILSSPMVPSGPVKSLLGGWFARVADSGTLLVLDDLRPGRESYLRLQRPDQPGFCELALSDKCISALALSPDGERAALCLRPERLVSMKAHPKWHEQVRRNSEMRVLQPREASEQQRHLEAHCQQIAEPTLLIIDTASLAVLGSWFISSDPISLEFSSDGARLALVETASVSVYNVGVGMPPLKVQLSRDSLQELSDIWSAKETETDATGQARRSNALGDEDVQDLRNSCTWTRTSFIHDGRGILAWGFASPSGKRTARSASDMYYGIHWDLERGEQLSHVSPLPDGPCTTTLDGRVIVHAEGDGIVLSDTRTGEELAFYPVDEVAAFCIRDEGRIAVVTKDGHTEVLELLH